MGILAWLRRSLPIRREPQPPAADESPDENRDEEQVSGPLDKATAEARSHVHDRSHLTG